MVPAGTGAGGGPGLPRRSGQDRGSLPPRAAVLAPPLSLPRQDLLEALGQLREEELEPVLEDEPAAGAEDRGSEWDLPGAESGPPGAPPPAASSAQPAEGQSQWRSLLSSYRRRPFSGCFGTRMERIGAQTGLGCNQYKARRSRLEPAAPGSWGGRGSRRERPLSPAERRERLPQQRSALLSQVSGGGGEAEAGSGSPKLALSLHAGVWKPDRKPVPGASTVGGWKNKLLYNAYIAFCEWVCCLFVCLFWVCVCVCLVTV